MGYTESIGLFKLRELISTHYRSKQHLNLPISNIAITAGASASILLILMTLFNLGDCVAIMQPGYPCYKNILKSLGLKTYEIRTRVSNNFQLTPQDILKIPKNVKGIILESPSNPTGSIIENDNLKEIAGICKKKKLQIISDEIYHGIFYSAETPNSILKYNNDAVVINSFSKYFLMTGWRLGWIIGKSKVINNVSKLAMNLYLSPSSVSQFTALKVFNNYDYFDDVVSGYKKNKNFIIRELKRIGLDNFVNPMGAFYIYLNIKKLSNNSFKFCKEMVKDIRVTAAPGIDFDDRLGKNYIRLSYAGKKNQLSSALKRLEKWI